jgi:hypothetical protein
MFNLDHKLISYYVSALCLYKIDQLCRTADLNKDFKKFKYHLLMIIKILVMGPEKHPANSNKLEKSCEQLKKILVDELASYILISTAVGIAMNSGIDKTKERYKTESETEIMKNAARDEFLRKGYFTKEKIDHELNIDF